MKGFVSIFIILHLSGFLPFSIKTVFASRPQGKTSNFIIASTIVGLIIVVLEVYFSFKLNVLESFGDLELSNEILKFSACVLAHFFCVVESWVTRKRQEEIWILNTAAKNCLGIKLTNNTEFFRWILYKFYCFLTIAIGFEVYFVLSTRDNKTQLQIWAVSILSTLALRIRYLQHVMYSSILTKWFSHLKIELKILASLQLKSQEVDKQYIIERLLVLKQLYSILYEMSLCLNSCFGISQLFCLLDNFVQLTCDFYWIYTLVVNDESQMVPEVIVVIVSTLIILVSLLTSCEKCLRKVRYVLFYIQEIDLESLDENFNLIVENFTLLALNQEISFNVGGFLTMHFHLLHQIFASIATYMVILIQFTPKPDITSMFSTLNSTIAELPTIILEDLD